MEKRVFEYRMNQDGSDEKNVNECDWNEADGMKEELIPKTR